MGRPDQAGGFDREMARRLAPPSDRQLAADLEASVDRTGAGRGGEEAAERLVSGAFPAGGDGQSGVGTRWGPLGIAAGRTPAASGTAGWERDGIPSGGRALDSSVAAGHGAGPASAPG